MRKEKVLGPDRLYRSVGGDDLGDPPEARTVRLDAIKHVPTASRKKPSLGWGPLLTDGGPAMLFTLNRCGEANVMLAL